MFLYPSVYYIGKTNVVFSIGLSISLDNPKCDQTFLNEWIHVINRRCYVDVKNMPWCVVIRYIICIIPVQTNDHEG